MTPPGTGKETARARWFMTEGAQWGVAPIQQVVDVHKRGALWPAVRIC